MSRDGTAYNQRREWVAPEGYGVNADAPVAGCYRFKLRSGGHPVGVRIWHGQPLDPVTGELLDRSLRWQAHCNGEYIDLERVWPMCAKQPITDQEYEYLTNVQRWGEQHAPDSPQANPTRQIDLLTAPIPF